MCPPRLRAVGEGEERTFKRVPETLTELELDGAEITFIAVDRAVLLPAPVQVKVYIVFVVGETPCAPLVDFVPVKVPPEAVQDVAPADDQVNTADCPEVIEVG